MTDAPPSWRRRALRWIAEHDDSWLFTALYVGLAVLLSIAISLFWLVAVVAAHGVLEWYALRHRGVRTQLLGRVLWHLKLDVGLVLFALWLGLYMETLFGMAGLGAAARTGARAGARFVAWQRTLRGVLLTIDDAAQVARAVVARKAGEGGIDDASATVSEAPPWRQRWGRADIFSVAFALLWALLILLTPLLTGQSVEAALAIVARDLHPWPWD